MKITSIVGARPQFIKLAPIVQALKRHRKNIRHVIIHTGQHYDYNMSELFFSELGIKEPDYHLNVGSGTHGLQTAQMMKRSEDILLKEKPDWVLVYGDTNTTLAGALSAAKLGIPVAHIEAGLRSYDKKMPEEINRVLTDHVSSVLFCPTESAIENLIREGFTNIINGGKRIRCLPNLSKENTLNIGPIVANVGDVMHDAILMCLKIAERNSVILDKYNLEPKGFYLATIHRVENADNKTNLKNIFAALSDISRDLPVVVPLHPRTKKSLKSLNFLSSAYDSFLKIIDPVGYFDMLILEKNAQKILTDSGGIQKEAFWLGVPCVTIRERTEWVETVKSGGNILVSPERKKIREATFKAKTSKASPLFKSLKEGAAELIIEVMRKIKYEL